MDAKSAVLWLHILCGAVAIVTMILAYITKKGPKMHAKVGRIYGYAMVGVGLTSIVLFLLGSSTFLLLIAFFSLYLVLVGWRFAVNRKGAITKVDNLLIKFGMIGGIALLLMAAFIASSGDAPFGLTKAFAAVPMTFGIISIALAYQQNTLQRDGSNPRGKQRISMHITYMGAGTISTVTAFTITVLGSSIFTWLGVLHYLYGTGKVAKSVVDSDSNLQSPSMIVWNQVEVNNRGNVAKSVVPNKIQIPRFN